MSLRERWAAVAERPCPGTPVTAKGADGDNATGYSDTVHPSSSDSVAVLPANDTFTGGDAGVHVFSVTVNTAGIRSLVATDTVTATSTGSVSITVSPDASQPQAGRAPVRRAGPDRGTHVAPTKGGAEPTR